MSNIILNGNNYSFYKNLSGTSYYMVDENDYCYLEGTENSKNPVKLYSSIYFSITEKSVENEFVISDYEISEFVCVEENELPAEIYETFKIYMEQ